MRKEMVTIDGNEAAAYVAHKTNEVISIYPITPASAMGELADAWSARGMTNIWGSVPKVQEMQSEGGAAGAIHGALQTGALSTTFTASQGLLLMIPNMYKIAGELTSTVFHIAARSVATHALSIFGDHSDVMAARTTGWAMLFANTVQEAMDMALIAQAATLKTRVPFLHIFDGFRTSHEVMKIEKLPDDAIRAMIRDEFVRRHRLRGMSPDRPCVRGTAQNPDVFFQSREAVNLYYDATPSLVQETMDEFARLTGRPYKLFDYFGAPDAERVIVIMGSGAEAVEETVDFLGLSSERVGVLKVRLYRPFSAQALIEALPETVKAIAVLDRTKEPGSVGEPLYLDVVAALNETVGRICAGPKSMPRVIGGRYGLSSKEFTPAMVKGIFDELNQIRPKNHFTIGIRDDVTETGISYDPAFSAATGHSYRALFWGLGSDGTVGANKNSIKIIGEETDNYVQGYFVYDSKKAGTVTVSHLRVSPKPIHRTYLVKTAHFIAVHHFSFIHKFDTILDCALEGATLLINSVHGANEIWDRLPRIYQERIIAKKIELYVINAYAVARELGLGSRINTIMQTCFFAISEIIPRDEAVKKIKAAITKSYGKRGDEEVRKNFAAVDAALTHLVRVPVPAVAAGHIVIRPPVPAAAPEFVRRLTGPVIAGHGDDLPVSAFPPDGTYPSATTQWEKRNIALDTPVWEPDLCIQCGKCVMVCPHAAIRAKVYDAELLASAPEGFKSSEPRWKEPASKRYSLQVSVEDCTGCRLCVEVCPVKDKRDATRRAVNMAPVEPLRIAEIRNWEFFKNLPDVPRADGIVFDSVKNVQLLRPLFEFSGACAACGETPYLKLLSQLFGDRAVIANATGCSSIFGGNLPTTPWAIDARGRGPAWNNSLFEDNAEFGLGMRLSLDKQAEYARELLIKLTGAPTGEWTASILNARMESDAEIEAQRARIEGLKRNLAALDTPEARELATLADMLVRKSVWIVGGDGWAYDIGAGGLDHVLATRHNVNILVLDTEVYSNTGGQSSKSTPRGAVAKFAAGGKETSKKDLGLMAMSYGSAYVAQVAMGANDFQTIKAFQEAEAYDGPAIIIAYSHCIAHGIAMHRGMAQQKLAVETGIWPLYRYNPAAEKQGKKPLALDSPKPKSEVRAYLDTEDRYRMLAQINPEAAAAAAAEIQRDVNRRRAFYEHLAGFEYPQTR